VERQRVGNGLSCGVIGGHCPWNNTDVVCLLRMLERGMFRVIVGFAFAPLVGVLVSSTVVAAASGDLRSGWWVLPMAGVIIAYPSALLFGVPSYLVVRRFLKLKWWHAVFAGFLCSLPAWLASAYPFTGAYFERRWLPDLTLYVMAGIVAGAVFWLVARDSRSNPALQGKRDEAARP